MLPNETQIFNDQRGEYSLCTDRARLDLDYILRFMNEKSYWAKDTTMDALTRSIEGAIPFGVYLGEEQVGFARVVTDCVVIGYLMDVFIDANHGGKGLACSVHSGAPRSSGTVMRYFGSNFPPLTSIRLPLPRLISSRFISFNHGGAWRSAKKKNRRLTFTLRQSDSSA